MALSFSYALKTSLRKYRRKPLRTIFGLVPTMLLTIVIVIMSGLALSADVFLKDRILSKVESREQIITLSKRNAQTYGGPTKNPSEEDPSAYTKDDLVRIAKVTHVSRVDQVRSLPMIFGGTTDAVSGHTLFLQDLAAAPTSLGQSYGASGFTFNETSPIIPVIITRNFFTEQKLDWGGKDTIKITEKELQDPEKANEFVPSKNKFLNDAYDKTKLLGQTFTVHYSQVQPVATGTIESNYSATAYSQTYKKFTPAEYAAEQKKQQDALSPYWNYPAIVKGITVRYKIVGFNESLDPYSSSSYIPDTAAVWLLQQLYDNLAKARTAKALPAANDLQAVGWIVTKGDYLQSTLEITSYTPNPLASKNVIGDNGDQGYIDKYYLLGFAYRLSGTRSNTITEQKDLKLASTNLPILDAVVVLDNASNRDAASKDLVSAGFPEAISQFSFTNGIKSVSQGMKTALLWVVGVLGIVNAFLLIISVGRSVSDAQREIGVFRALGARRRDIRFLYVVFSAVQTVMGVFVGLGLGLVVLVALANFLAPKMKSVLGGAGAGFGFDLVVHPQDLMHIDLVRVIGYGCVLVVITAIVSLIPAAKAARISPVEAIRKAD
ncbi:MAG TPA: FtsX-like permease family protein [Candidatus Saccharimonadia bacterium]